jgi:hypothetical protein
MEAVIRRYFITRRAIPSMSPADAWYLAMRRAA